MRRQHSGFVYPYIEQLKSVSSHQTHSAVLLSIAVRIDLSEASYNDREQVVQLLSDLTHIVHDSWQVTTQAMRQTAWLMLIGFLPLLLWVTSHLLHLVLWAAIILTLVSTGVLGFLYLFLNVLVLTRFGEFHRRFHAHIQQIADNYSGRPNQLQRDLDQIIQLDNHHITFAIPVRRVINKRQPPQQT